MRECHDGIYAPLPSGDFGPETVGNLLGDAIDAAHGRDDPDLVPDAHLSVGAAEAQEGAFFRGLGDLHQRRPVAVFQQAFQIGLDAGVVHL